MADRHVLKVSPKNVQWGVWDASLEPVAGGVVVVLAPVKFLGRPSPHPAKASGRLDRRGLSHGVRHRPGLNYSAESPSTS